MLQEYYAIDDIFTKLNEEFSWMAIRSVMHYESQCQAAKKKHIQMISVAEMRMFKWVTGDIVNN